MYDLLISHGRIVDGTGSPWFFGDVGIRDGKIEDVGDLTGAVSRREIDAKGRVICPGFVDIHSHNDISVILNPRCDGKLAQGITTEVVGNCGLSATPITSAERHAVRHAVRLIDPDAASEWPWNKMDGYLEAVDAAAPALNVAALIGHVTLRADTMGFENRPATPSEMTAMCAVVAEAMEAGAVGMSTGLMYPPGCYAGTDEIVALCRVVRKYGGFYATHMRSYDGGLADAVRETITIAEQAEIPVQISHHVCVGRANWHCMTESFALIEAARSRGVEITMDVYPYAAGSANLSQLIPARYHEGGPDRLVERLHDRSVRDEIIADWERNAYWSPDEIMVSNIGAPDLRELVGRKIPAIADAFGCSPFEAILTLVADADDQVDMVAFSQSEDNVRENLRHPLVTIGTDGLPFKEFGDGQPHPRYYGAHVRVLGHYVRTEKLLGLEEAIRKMTSFPARIAGLWDRGIVRPGMAADLVIMDPDTVADRATYTAPHQYAAGIEAVVVNGRLAIDGSRQTSERAGSSLRHRG